MRNITCILTGTSIWSILSNPVKYIIMSTADNKQIQLLERMFKSDFLKVNFSYLEILLLKKL